MTKTFKFLVAVSLAFAASNLFATVEFVKKTFVASNKLQLPYRAAEKADPNGGKVPVVVFLHGYGQCGVDNSFTINEMTNIKSYLDSTGSDGYKLLVPQCPNDVKWAEFAMSSTTCTFQEKPSSALVAVFDLLDSYAAMADVDANRIYVTGLSMGGHGTWDAICRRPDFFAAAMPCCGGGDPVCAADIAHVPVLAVHNRGDPTIPVEQTEGIVTALRAFGSDVIFEKLENNSHDAWTTCYSRTDDVTAGAPNHRFVWLFAQNRATNNHQKYPRITEITATPSGSSATISLAGLVLGTDANAVPATKYSIAYKLDGAANAVTALSNQTAEDNSFSLADLADGNHTCEVTMTTDKGRTKTKSVVFYVNASAASDAWTSAQMDAAGNSFSKEGTLLYAYSSNGGTVNGIRFERDVNLQGSSLKVAFEPNIDSFTGDFMNDGASGDFGVMLSNGWYWNDDGTKVRTFKLTLSGLEGGKSYLVQFLSHNFWNNNTTVSANGCSPVHIHGDNEAGGKYGALITGTFTAMGDTKEVTITYSNVNGKIPLNGIQVRELDGGGSGGGGGATVVSPSIGSVSATTNGATATISLSGIVMGTDDNGTNATSYSVSYSLNNASAVTALTGRTGTTASFGISDLPDGSYTCAVTITTDKNKAATKSVSFTIATSSQGGGGGGEPGPTPQAGWTAGPMSADGSTIRTDGTLLYAYANEEVTVGGVPFDRAFTFGAASMVSASPASAGNSGGSFGDSGASGDFGAMLRNGWYWEGEEGSLSFTLTLKGLTAGNSYLVQLVSHRTSNSTTISVNGSTPVHINGSQDGVNYNYGGYVVGVFTASAATASFTVSYPTGSGMRPLNAIQVRDLGEGGGSGGGGEVTVVEPSIEGASVTTNGAVATVFLSGIEMGTDDAGTNATSYSVSYSLNNAPAVTVLSNQTGATASFSISDLADGSYTCSITIATDKNKTATKMVSFAISASSQGGSGGGGSGNSGDPTPLIDWTVETLSASDETMLRTDGTLLYAYRGASTARTLGDVTFQAGADLSAANISFDPAFNNADENAGSTSLLGTAWNFGFDMSMADIRLTLSGLTAGHAYLLQILARNSFGNPSITIGDLPAVSIQNGNGSSGATVYGSFTAEGTSHVVVFKMGGSGAARYVAAIQVRDLGESSGGGGSGGDETSYEIVAGPDTTNTLHLAKIAEYAFASNGCGAITYSGQGGIFYVLQDHDDDNYARIHTLALDINPSTGAILSQNFGATFTPSGLRDAEGLALDPLSGTLWASSEWTPPSISEFGTNGTATGRTAPVPAIQRDKLRSNLSLEALTISTDGLTMWTANEQALTCDGESSNGNTNVATVVRLTRFTRATAQDAWAAAGEWAYACDPCANTTFAQCGLSGLCALPDGSLLALEREVSIATWGRCRIYRITTGALAAATEVSNLSSVTNSTVSLVAKGSPLVSFTGTDLNNIIVYEGIALGPKLSDGSYGVYLVSDGGATMTKSLGLITVTAKTVSRICALKLTGLPDDGTGGLTPETEAPVIGGEGVDAPFVVGADKIAITISNAVSGRRYGYKKSATIDGLKTADVIYFEALAGSDGVVVFEIPKIAGEQSSFYQLVVE